MTRPVLRLSRFAEFRPLSRETAGYVMNLDRLCASTEAFRVAMVQLAPHLASVLASIVSLANKIREVNTQSYNVRMSRRCARAGRPKWINGRLRRKRGISRRTC